METKSYMVIDLKSFFASVECVARGLDPMTTRLVVADPERNRGTICLAVSPAMKAAGVRNRCRVYEIPESIEYIMAPPRMQLYIDTSADIYAIYLKYIAKEDIHIYSIDEAFLDVTTYLKLYNLTARELALRIMNEISKKTGLRATCGIGSNMYLAKVALDILAKHAKNYIAELTEESYQDKLWKHKPITDFWRIGAGTAQSLYSLGLVTMEDIAKAPEKILYQKFGSGAEYMIDHAWGREPCTIAQIKNYKSKNHSMSVGQVLFRDYKFDEALIVVKEMAENLSLEMVDRGVVSDCFSLMVGYSYNTMPSVGHTKSIDVTTNSVRIIRDTLSEIFSSVVKPDGMIRRIGISANNVVDECFEQYSIFVDPRIMEQDRVLARSVNTLKDKFGKNAVLKGLDLEDAATAIERNKLIGGHKSE